MLLALGNYWSKIVENDFSYGFFWGASLVVAVLLLLWLLNVLSALFFRSRRCRELEVSSSGGLLFVSEGAVVSAVKILGVDFPWLELGRIRLYRKRGKGYELSIRIRYELSKERSLPDEVSKYRNALREGLSGMLGITEDLAIVVNLSGVRAGRSCGITDCADEVSETESGIAE